MQNYEKHLEFNYGPNWKQYISGGQENWTPRKAVFRLEPWHGK